jgi:catechol 2,3-dioxygenase-like lactoylglutathione lyase family enzyme
MLGDSRAKAFVGVADLDAGRAFYEGVLGLTIKTAGPFSVVAVAGGVEVDDVAGMARALKAKGVTFEIYPGFDQDADGVWTAPSGTKVAWFKDPDGNLLSLSGEG